MNFLQFCLCLVVTRTGDWNLLVALKLFNCAREQLGIVTVVIQSAGKVAEIIQSGSLPGGLINRIEVADIKRDIQFVERRVRLVKISFAVFTTGATTWSMSPSPSLVKGMVRPLMVNSHAVLARGCHTDLPL